MMSLCRVLFVCASMKTKHEFPIRDTSNHEILVDSIVSRRVAGVVSLSIALLSASLHRNNIGVITIQLVSRVCIRRRYILLLEWNDISSRQHTRSLQQDNVALSTAASI